MKKRISALILCVAMCCSLTACGNKVSSSSSTFEESSSNRPSSTVSSSSVTSSSSTVSSSSSTGIVDERPNDYIDDLVDYIYNHERDFDDCRKGRLLNTLSVRESRKGFGCNQTTKGLFGKRKNVSECISLL